MYRKIIALFLVCVMVAVCVSCQSNKITVEQYDQVEDGMTYDQVKEIFQDQGELDKEVGEIGKEDYYIYRSWKLNDGSIATMSFTGPDLVLDYKTRRFE